MLGIVPSVVLVLVLAVCGAGHGMGWDCGAGLWLWEGEDPMHGGGSGLRYKQMTREYVLGTYCRYL